MTTVTNKNHVFETFSASGTVFLTLDNQLAYRHRFEQHIQVNIVYDYAAIPGTANEHSHSVSCLDSDVFTDYSSECCNSLTSSTYIQPMFDGEHIKPGAGSDFVNSISHFNLDNQMPGVGSSSIVVETVDSIKDGVSQLLHSQDAFVTKPQNNDAAVADVGRVDGSEAKEDVKPEFVNGQKSVNDADDNSVRENPLEDSELNSKRLSRLSLKISRQPTNSFQTNFRNKIKEVKAKKTRVKIEGSDKEPAVKLLTRLKRTSEKFVTNTENMIFDKLKIKNRDTNSQREPKVRKLELEKDVKCEYCFQIFKSQQEYFDHRKGDRTSFECKICGKVLPFKAHLMVHMRKHDNNSQEEFLPYKESDKTKAQSSESITLDGAGNYRSSKHIKCDMCGLTVSNIPILKTHMLIHTGEYAYKCCVCGERTHSIAKQSSHLATHLKSGKVQCKICNIRFETRSDLSRHQLTHEFKCSICGKAFPNKTSRVFHYKMAHKDDILKCEICGKLFSSEEELAPHLKYHRNRAKTQCTICGLFVTRLDNHVLSHSQRSEDSKMYVCDQCPKQFKQKLSFQRHLRTHSEEKPYACMECPKRFARSGGLRRHMTTHTQEKPFVCSICGKACSQMGNLRIHMQIHKGCSLVQCKICGETFPYKNSLQEHMKITHYVDLSSQAHSRITSDATQLYYL